MKKRLKVHTQEPVDVRHLQKLTPEEQEAQRCDVRSRIAEISDDPNKPVRAADNHPNLGGRRLFLHLFNTLFEQVPRVRKSQLQKPNMKALHLHSAAFHWQRAQDLYNSLTDKNKEMQQDAVEEIGMDFMEAIIISVYSTIASIDVFSQEIMFEKLDAEAQPIGKPDSLVDTLRLVLPKLTNKSKPTQTAWWQDFRNIHRARNSFTHTGMKKQEREEQLAKAWEALLRPNLDPPDVVRRVICHFSVTDPAWIQPVIQQGKVRAKACRFI